MRETETDEDAKRKYKAKSILASLRDLKPEQVEEIAIGVELAMSDQAVAPRGELIDISDIASEIEAASKEWGQVGGLSTGLPSLDRRIGGMREGDIIMIAGNPGGGKSALAGNIAVNVAKHSRVLFLSLEMLPKRIGVRFKHYNGGTIDDLQISFQKESSIDYRHLKPLFESASKKGMKLAVLDYFQYLGRGMQLDEVAKMSVEMKKLAQEFKVPFVIILSLRKGGAQFKRKWTDVELEDLMGTSAIGYDADAVIIASRKDPDSNFDPDHQWLKIVKVRDMPESDEFVRLAWDKTKVSESSDPDWIPSAKEIEDAEEDKLSQGQLPYKD